jgi:hypothetical protein
MKRVSLLFLTFAIGCGSSQSSAPSTGSKQQPAATTEVAATGKPSSDEAIDSIREYFTDRGAGVGYQKVDVERVSDPVEAPKDVGEAWAFSVTMKCESILGDTLHNKNWLVLIGREQGKAKVKQVYNDLNRIAESPLGKEWFVKSKFPEPSVE